MKLPSIQILLNESKKTFLRFPATIITAIIGSSLSIYLIGKDLDHDDATILFRIIMTSILAIPLLTSGKLFIERNNSSKLQETITYGILLSLLAINYILLPENSNNSNNIDFYRYFLSGGAYGLTLTFAGFLIKNEIRGFWEFSKILFIKFFSTILYTGVLFFGIAVALAAIDYLLDVTIDEKLYFQIWIFITGIIAPWLFLNGFPKNLKELNKTKTYHKSIRIFSQYILVPLVVTYLIILYLYSGKILLINEWPVSEVTYLTIFFALAGIITNLLLYPVQQDKSQPWAKWFEKAFFIALLPTLGMLFYAIWLRISPFGITENRYFVVIIGLWLLGISIYKIFSKEKNIKITIISFTAIILLSNYGPWSAYSISKNSQFDRLKTLLIQYEGLDNNAKAQKLKKTPTNSDKGSIISINKYLIDNHGYKSIQELFNEDIKKFREENSSYSLKRHITHDILGLTSPSNNYNLTFKYFQSDRKSEISIKGFDYLYDIDRYIREQASESNQYKIEITDSPTTIVITSKENNSSLSIPLKPLTDKLKKSSQDKSFNLPYSKLNIEKENKEIKVKIYFNYINTKYDKVNPYSLNGIILIKDKTKDQTS